jgi:hypothetical protein
MPDEIISAISNAGESDVEHSSCDAIALNERNRRRGVSGMRIG